MPFSGGTSGAHDDAMHQGNAKRDVADGLAALDASGFVLAKGAGIAFPRSGSDDVHIYERTSGEEAYAFHRVGVDDYTFFIKESNVWKRFQTESMKDVVDGIAALNGSGDLLVPGGRLGLTRDGSNNIEFRERTADEIAFYFNRVGVNDYTGNIRVGGGTRVIQHAGLKDIANGIAGLDASVEIPVALLKTSVASGIPVLDSDVKVLADQMPVPMLTVAQFQANAATGTVANPERANDNMFLAQINFNNIGEYVEVQFDHYNFITKYRMYGNNSNAEDGAYKIQHYEDGGWVDNTLNIPTNLTLWSSWALLDISVYTKAIRLVATAIDTASSVSVLAELQIEG